MFGDWADQELDLEEHERDLVGALRLKVEIDIIATRLVHEESCARWLAAREAEGRRREPEPN